MVVALPMTCGIVAGGASSRMGRNKALLPFRGRHLLGHQMEIVRPLFERVIVGANEPSPYLRFGAEVVPDLLDLRCALTAIHAILRASRTEHAFVVACDLPFLNPGLMAALAARRLGRDAVVPESDTGLEPLHAIYSRSCLPAIEEAARRGRWKVSDFYAGVRMERWRVRDGEWLVEGRSPFTNVNTPSEWRTTAPAWHKGSHLGNA